MNNLCHVVNDPIEGVLVDVLQGLATVELLQIAELHLHLLLFLQGRKIRSATKKLRIFQGCCPKF